MLKNNIVEIMMQCALYMQKRWDRWKSEKKPVERRRWLQCCNDV